MKKAKMHKRTVNPMKFSQGFTLVELIIVMAIFIMVIVITGNAFNLIQKQASLQSRTAESNIAGVVGLEIMQKDLASAGFGLPWEFQSAINYNEAEESPASDYNDAPSGVPRAASGGNNLTPGDSTKLLEGTDYLVIRATSVGTTRAAQCWNYMNYTTATKPASPMPIKSWTAENLHKDDLVVVETMNFTPPISKVLVIDSVSGKFYGKYPGAGQMNLAGFEPQQSKVTNYIYGVYQPDSDVTELRMPFNRADYYVRTPAAGESVKLPGRCAPNTGILFKGIVSQKDGKLGNTELPLLDCVADMQVVYSLYDDSTGVTSDKDTLTNSLGSPLSAADIRTGLKTIKVYILTHDGGKDTNFTYSNQYIAVGPSADGINTGSGRKFDLQSTIITGWRNYRWKVYRMIVNLSNMDSSIQ